MTSGEFSGKRLHACALVLIILVVVGVIFTYSWLKLPHLDHRCTHLQWTDYRRGTNPLVIRIKGSAYGPTYTASQGVNSNSSWLVAAQYADWIESIRMLLPTLLKEEPRGEIIAELVITQKSEKWVVRIGRELSPASSRLLNEVGNKMPGLYGPP